MNPVSPPGSSVLTFHVLAKLSSSSHLQFDFPAVSELMLLQGCSHFGDLPPCFAAPDGLWSLVYTPDPLTPAASSAAAFLGAPGASSSP